MRRWVSAHGSVSGRLGVCVITYAVFAVTNSDFRTSGNFYAVLVAVAFIGMIALGVSATMLAGELDLSVGSVAACTGIIAVKLAHIGLFPTLLIVLVGGIAYGAIQGIVIARLRVSSLVFTIGTLIGMQGVAYILANNQTISLGLNELGLSDEITRRIASIFSPFAFVTIAVFIVVGLLLAYTRAGREIYAFGGGRNESRAAGVSQTRPIVLSFTCSGALAALAGGLSAIGSGGASPFGFDTVLLSAVTAALVGGVSLYGGRGDVFGVFIGVLTLQFLLAGLSLDGAADYVQEMATGALLFGFIVLEFFTEGGGVELFRRSMLGRQRRRAQAYPPSA